MRLGAIPFQTDYGTSLRRIPQFQQHEQGKIGSNLAISGRPIQPGKVTVTCINKITIDRVEYGFLFGPLRNAIAERDSPNGAPSFSRYCNHGGAQLHRRAAGEMDERRRDEGEDRDARLRGIKTFKVSGSCYEIYGYTNDGRKAEVYSNPVTGDRVKSYIGG